MVNKPNLPRSPVPPIAVAPTITMWIWLMGMHELLMIASPADVDDAVPYELPDSAEDDDEQDGGEAHA